MLDPRIQLTSKPLVPMSRLTDERVTFKKHKDGSAVTVKDKSFLTLANTGPRDPKEWKGGRNRIEAQASIESIQAHDSE